MTRAEIISVGTEHLLGQITDTNAVWLCNALAAAGIAVYYRSTVGDNVARVQEVFREAPGRVVAHYVVRYADGDEARLPIRERFEISLMPAPYGQLPFLAVPYRKNYLMPRYEGPWGDAGNRLAEVEQVATATRPRTI